MGDKQKLNVNLGLNMDDFEGRYANVFQVATFGPEARLDCVYIDKASASETGECVGKVVARINMTTQSLIELRDLLDTHVGSAVGDAKNAVQGRNRNIRHRCAWQQSRLLSGDP